MRLGPIFILCSLFVLGVIMLIAMHEADRAAENARHSHHCYMVKLHQETGGEYGWPPGPGWPAICREWLQQNTQDYLHEVQENLQ